MPVLVTGAGGFIGSHLVEELVQRGARVRVFLRYTSRSDVGNLRYAEPAVLDAVEAVYGDLRDPDAVTDAAAGCDTVLHLGALIAIPYSYQHPREVAETNVLGTLNVLEAARRHDPRRVVHISTSEVYGTARFVPITEEHPLQGQSPYSASKIGADKIAESYARSFNVPVVTVRPFNTYGPRQSARAVIPTIIAQVLTRDSVRLGSTTTTRDFTFVRDTVSGMILAAERPLDSWTEVNLGSNSDVSIGALAEMIMGLAGLTVPIEQQDVRLRPANSEVERLWADNAKAAEMLGWKPAVALVDGLRETIEWIRSHLHLYRPGEYER